jgi:surfeit locus 1 family protein
MTTRARASLVFLFIVVAVVCVRLGFWQRSRLHQRRARNAAALAARALPPVVLGAGSSGEPGGAGAADSSRAGRRVVATGTYDRSHEVVLRNEVYEGIPGVRVVTPLRLATGDSALLVIRGWVPAPDAISARLDSLDEPGEVTVRGLAEPIASGKDGGQPVARNGATTWRRLDLAALRRRFPYPILPIAVLQLPDSALPRYPRRLSAAPLDDGPHLSYMLQWFAFAATALIFAGIVGRPEKR